ncbi:sigma 54-interacting transcriptional regulator [Vitiosangium sp. GDMCC 1.1324]|uniref:sigma 54-interacting transcriptional regulator n=1 Tax=Vitiosangium sp. (strain GDMCC 1.1324) TaxID=2138576 RepID=UPI000D38EED9|nr:sigma 54-interacting transcriptional regulator [Vitiosangium sp. GDMCC 1.1324]PTL81917.1 Fis family transcriptional regulator [Vitiosangium sp. GDMCC 1.1324]
MTSVPPVPIPTHTLLGERARGDRLAAQQFHLVLLDTERAGTVYPLSGEVLRIGKAPENDVVLDHPTVSRNHLLVRRQGDRFLVQDLGSTNGTFLDGAQVREAYLRPGALIEAGDVRLRFSPQVAPVEIAPSAEDRLGELVGRSVPMRQIFALLQRIAPTDSTVLLVGETGTGKGAAAKALHKLSPRASGPLVVFDCASVSDSLIESELFGHEKGAFTGAVGQRIGCLERAHGGTLFLDEIDDLALDLQPKLLRALEDREFYRLGASTPVSFDAHIVVASKKDLWAETQAGRFREDLYFRLSVFTVTLPSLRDRKEDIPLLVDAFGGRELWERLPEKVREQFLGHTWPGNVRELRNAVERARHMADIPELAVEGLLRESTPEAPPPSGEHLQAEYSGPFKACKDELVRAFEREYLTRLLSRTKGNIARAAREAELDRKHLYSLLHKYGLVQSEGE